MSAVYSEVVPRSDYALVTCHSLLVTNEKILAQFSVAGCSIKQQLYTVKLQLYGNNRSIYNQPVL